MEISRLTARRPGVGVLGHSAAPPSTMVSGTTNGRSTLSDSLHPAIGLFNRMARYLDKRDGR
jgi:hypothetical protein